MYAHLDRDLLVRAADSLTAQLEILERQLHGLGARDATAARPPSPSLAQATQTLSRLTSGLELPALAVLTDCAADVAREGIAERDTPAGMTLVELLAAIRTICDDCYRYLRGEPRDFVELCVVVGQAVTRFRRWAGLPEAEDTRVIDQVLQALEGVAGTDGPATDTHHTHVMRPPDFLRERGEGTVPVDPEFSRVAGLQLDVLHTLLQRGSWHAPPQLAKLRETFGELKSAAAVSGCFNVADMADRCGEVLAEVATGELPPSSPIHRLLLDCLVQIAGVLGGNSLKLSDVEQRFARALASSPAAAVPPTADPERPGASRPAVSGSASSVEPADAPEAAPPHGARAVDSLDDLGQIDPELRAIFAEEADEHIATISRLLRAMEQGGAGKDAFQEIRRAAHTLKGAAAAVMMHTASRLAHRMEDLLDLLAERPGEAQHRVDLILRTCDAIHELCRTNTSGNEALAAQIDELEAAYQRGLEATWQPPEQSPSRAADAPPRSLGEAGDHERPRRLRQEPAPALPRPAGDGGTGTESSRSELPSASSLADVDLNELPGSDTAWLTAQEGPQHEAGSVTPRELLRVPLERLDQLVGLVSELLINRAAFEQWSARLQGQVQDLQPALKRLRTLSYDLDSRHSVDAFRNAASHAGCASRSTRGLAVRDFDPLEFDRFSDFHVLARSLAEATDDVGAIGNELRSLWGEFDALLARQARLTGAAQDRLMQIRMVPLESVRLRLERAVRNVAQRNDRQVTLQFEGGDIEIDKTVLEQVADPLLHLVRNAVDHGVESPAVRAAAGKPPVAIVRVSAYHQGTQVLLRVVDDGQGLDVDAIREQVLRRGLASAAELEQMSEPQLLNHIFLPGFSTAAEISEVSGRGIGLDVVRDKVHGLKGAISVQSHAGQGTVFAIRLPLSISVTRALLLSTRRQTFAIPMQAVSQILRLDHNAVQALGKGTFVRVNETAYPLVDLGDHLQLDGAPSHTTDMRPVLLVRSGEDQVALAVERILSSRDIVVKSMGSHLQHVPGVIGVTLMGDGRAVPILDPAELVCEITSGQPEPPAAVAPPREPRGRRPLHAVVVDDSVSVRRVTQGILENAGIRTTTARDGMDALEQLAAWDAPADIFLLDIEMPRMNGYELLKTLREQERYRATPVVMITSRAGEKHRAKAAELGADSYLTKPFQEERLVNLIYQLTETRGQPAGSG